MGRIIRKQVVFFARLATAKPMQVRARRCSLRASSFGNGGAKINGHHCPEGNSVCSYSVNYNDNLNGERH